MNQQNQGGQGNSGNQGNNRRPQNNNRRPNQGQQNQNQNQKQNAGGQQGGQGAGTGGNPNRRRHHHHKRPGGPRPQGNPQGGQQQQQGGGFNIDRIYEKYLNLLDQHLIARRKYHDLFYRADPAQKTKLERNFYSTLNDIREFENRLAPDVRDLFEKRNNGLAPDRTYTSNREMSVLGDEVSSDMEIEDPHYLQSQKNADFEEDKEESTGTLDDYLKYKNLL